jgi:hypothetical protein
MASTKEMSHTDYLAALKEAADPKAMQRFVLGMEYLDKDALEEAQESLLNEAEEAGDNKDFAPAAAAFRRLSVMAWGLDDNRMIENVGTQALYYGTLAGFDTLLENYATVWAMWAHMLPKLKPRDRARLQDFARFRRSFDLGMREREENDAHINAAVSLLAPTFDQLGKLNLRANNDRKVDLAPEMPALWDEASKLLVQIESAVAR